MSLHESLVTWGRVALAAAAVGALTAPLGAEDWVIRVSQESAPGAGDFDSNVLGFVRPFETLQTSREFYGFDGSSYTGSYICLALQPDRSHLMFLRCADAGMTAVAVHDAIGDPDGGIAEMMYELIGDDDGGMWGERDERGGMGPGGDSDLYSGSTGDMVYTSAQSWGRCCTDGLALCGLDNVLRIQFRNVDGDPETVTVAGLTEWVVYSLDGTQIPLVIQEERRAQFEFLRTCQTDLDLDGKVDVSDLLILLSAWGVCPFVE